MSAKRGSIEYYPEELLRDTILNITAGWFGMLAGILSGALLGLFFHREDWMGGYSSYRRRLTRLGHISFFGLGFLNLVFGATVVPLNLSATTLRIASWSFVVAAATMPACCFLAAWRKPLRHLFPVPVISALTGILAVLFGMRTI